MRLFPKHRPELLGVCVVRWTAKYDLRELLAFVITAAVQSERKSLSHSIEVVITTVSRYGPLGLLQWMHKLVAAAAADEVGTEAAVRKYDPWTSATCGHVHILQWLKDESKLTRAMQACVGRDS